MKNPRKSYESKDPKTASKRAAQSGFVASPLRLSPEVVEARRERRRIALSKTAEQVAEEIRQERRESAVKDLQAAFRANWKEIVFSYLAFMAIIGGAVALGSWLG